MKEITLQAKPDIMIAKFLFADRIREYSELKAPTRIIEPSSYVNGPFNT